MRVRPLAARLAGLALRTLTRTAVALVRRRDPLAALLVAHGPVGPRRSARLAIGPLARIRCDTLVLVGVLSLFPAPARAAESLAVAPVYGDHMVLQRDREVPVRGRAAPGATVTVALAGRRAQGTADEDGRWRAVLPALAAGGPYTLTVTAPAAPPITIEDVWIGEVWLCGGQSNMEFAVRSVTDAAAEVARADHPRIRQFTVPHRASATPLEDTEGTWSVCTPTTVGSFSACGYFMARRLAEELDVAVGIISSNWGGTRIEPWTPPEGFTGIASLRDIADTVARRSPNHPAHRAAAEAWVAAVDAWLDAARRALDTGEPLPPHPSMPPVLVPPTSHQDPVMLWNGMLHGLAGFPLRGATWYQGESNHGEGRLYADKMRALIAGWRAAWGDPALPFHFVQIAPFRYGAEDPHVLPEFWEAQAEIAHTVPGCGMVVINDVATIDDIHPPDKQTVGRRLADLALRRLHGRKDVIAGGPEFASLKTRGNALHVTFTRTAGGLAWRGGQPGSDFEIIGPGSGWEVATARIRGDTVILRHPDVSAPVAVRFAWNKTATPNLINGAALPTGAFRAGVVPRPDALGEIDEARDYTLVLDLDLRRLGPTITYDTDDRDAIRGAFTRVAFLVETESADGEARHVWVSMDAFTDDPAHLGIPTAASGARFVREVENVRIDSNVAGVASGRRRHGVNLEFWPDNYGPVNAAGVPGAADDVHDTGDQPSPPIEGYGSMQIHDHRAGITLFAINHWTAGSRADVGLGSSEGRSRDWTFAANAAGWRTARLRVFVR